MLSVRQVSAGYGKVLAIQDIDLNVERGEIVVLLGANGAGKSTLIRTIAGGLRPRSGEIEFNGQRIEGKKAHQVVKSGIVHVQEGRGVLSRMSVRENLVMGAYLRRDKDSITRDLQRVFALFPRLEERIEQNAGTLSGGEQQMLVIARALMASPKLLLLDEPSLGLAPIVVEYIFKTIRELSENDGYTILLVEQNANQALEVATRGYVMETGRMVFQGDRKMLMESEEVQRAYLGG